WTNINSRSCSGSRSAHSGSTTRGDHTPTTAGPTLGETSTCRPSMAARRHRRCIETKRVVATPSTSTSAIDASPHPQRSGASRSVREKGWDEGWGRMVEVVEVGGSDEAPDDSIGSEIGATNVENASGRSQAAIGTTNDPSSAMLQAQRVGRPAKCSPRSSAWPTTTNAKPIPTQYSIQTAITWHLP